MAYELDSSEVRIRYGNGFVKETCYILHPDTEEWFLRYVKYLKFGNTNDFKNEPAYILYHFLSNKIKKISHYNNNLQSNINGPAVICFDIDGNLVSEEYYINGTKFNSKQEWEKHIKLMNIS